MSRIAGDNQNVNQFSPAEVDPVDAGLCGCFAPANHGGLPLGDRGAIALLQLWRLHADRLIRAPDIGLNY
jgi:hypothetical protein